MTFSLSGYAEVIGIEKGQPAPFDGVLLDKETAVKMLTSQEFQEKECNSKVEYEVGKATNSCSLEKGILEAKLASEIERNKKISAIKEREIDRLNKEIGKTTGNWGPVWFLAGASIGIATSIVIFFISVQTVNNTDIGPS
jgi:hypothetical protein